MTKIVANEIFKIKVRVHQTFSSKFWASICIKDALPTIICIQRKDALTYG